MKIRHKKVVLVFGTPSEAEDNLLLKIYGRTVTQISHADIPFNPAAAHQDLEGYLNTMVEENPSWKKAVDQFHGSDPKKLRAHIIIEVRNSNRFFPVIANNTVSFDPTVEFIRAIYEKGKLVGYRRIINVSA